MAYLIKIGNSRGVRIPKALIQQAGLEGKELEFDLVEDGLVIKPVRYQVRQGWEQKIREAVAAYDPDADEEWLNAPLTDDSEWEW